MKRVLLGVVLLILFIALAGPVFGLIWGTFMFVLRLAIAAALIGGGVYAYRRLSGKSRRPSLGRGGTSDWDFIRGRVDKDTYLRRKSLGS